MKITQAGWIYAQRYEWEQEYRYTFFQGEEPSMSDYGHIAVMPHELVFELPSSFTQVPAEIVILRRKIERVRAESQSKVTLLQERISKLLAIEHKPERSDE
ncbi:MAG: hypothetical protein NUV51_03595 [Sulfuricaulis sp.]|nr:hypothetical protein [Sulfuricaulis sp.]